MKPNSELLNLTGKAAIVTGGAKGIGLGIAARLAEAGAKVLVADMDGTAATEAAQQLADRGFTASAFTVDMAEETQIQAMIQTCKDNFGSVDILVNNAGIYPPSPIEAMEPELFEKVINVNLRGCFLSIKYAAQIMKEQGGGKIINVTSIDALHPSMVGLAHYDASKHGLWGFTKNAALEFAKYNIQVNALAPGGITTPGTAAMQGPESSDAETMQKQVEAFLSKIPMHRMGEPDEIGKAVLFLASDMSSYMTGSQLVVDGGALLS
jgi:2-deoxy-D-gluconate 3-dehydrogenase